MQKILNKMRFILSRLRNYFSINHNCYNENLYRDTYVYTHNIYYLTIMSYGIYSSINVTSSEIIFSIDIFRKYMILAGLCAIFSPITTIYLIHKTINNLYE